MSKTFCIDCGAPSEGTRCTEHTSTQARATRSRSYERERPYNRRQWRRLSVRARAIQPWCSDCGSGTDLTTDHSPTAWTEYERTGSVPMHLVTVRCRGCNTAAGPARGSNVTRAN